MNEIDRVSMRSPGRPHGPLAPVFTIARRQFRSGLSGFYVFIACLALGVMAIAAVGALTDSLREGLKRQGREILGGDIVLKRVHTRASDHERAILDDIAKVSESLNMRAMAGLTDGSEQTLIELRGVDAAYPLVGKLELRSRQPGGVASIGDNELDSDKPSGARAVLTAGASVQPLLLERLGLKLGDKLKIGTLDVEITALIDKLPDALSGRLSYGPTVILPLSKMNETGLVRPGALVRWRYALKLPGVETGKRALIETRAQLKSRLSGRGFTITDTRNPAPQIRRTLERLRQFLTLVGLTALLVGGVGVANAVSTFIDKNRKTIATLKSIGATGNQIFTLFLVEVLGLALVGVLIGLILGQLIPGLIGWFFSDTLPINLSPTLSVSSLVTALTYGVLVSLLFSIWPLGRLAKMGAAVLFRDEVAESSSWPSLPIIVLTVLLAVLLVALAVLSSDARKLAIYFCLSTALVFVVFIALGSLITWLARKAPHTAHVTLAIALRSLGAPGGLSKSIVLSLGTGLSVLVAVSIADASFQKRLESRLPETSPDYYVLDIPFEAVGDFKTVILQQMPLAHVRDAPMLRGRLVRLAGRPVEEIKPPDDASWVLHGDRGITYSDTVPEGSRLTAGAWWDKDYSGPPLVSFEADLAQKLGLKVSDTVTVNILGRDVTARIANLRKVDWDSLAINFVMVFSANTLEGAPSNRLATIKFSQGTTLAVEARLVRSLSKAFPTTVQIRVKDAIKAFNKIFKKIMTAVQVAGAFTLVMGALVLAGALSTARRRRERDAVILMTLGATRGRILMAHITEYLLIALVTAGFAIFLGGASATLVLTQAMDIPVAFSVIRVLGVIALSIALVLIFGGIGTWSVLKTRPVAILRAQ